jgi:hypothetical protein
MSHTLEAALSIVGIVATLVACAVGVGITLAGPNPPNFRAARAWFIFSASLPVMGCVLWLFRVDQSFNLKLLVSFAVSSLCVLVLVSVLRWVKKRETFVLCPLVSLEYDKVSCSFRFHKISGGPAFSVEAESEDIGDRNRLHFGLAETLADDKPQPATFSLLCWNAESKDYFPNGFVRNDFLTAADMIRAQMNQTEFSVAVTITCKNRFGQRVEPIKLALAHQKYGDPPVKIEFLGPWH